MNHISLETARLCWLCLHLCLCFNCCAAAKLDAMRMPQSEIAWEFHVHGLRIGARCTTLRSLRLCFFAGLWSFCKKTSPVRLHGIMDTQVDPAQHPSQVDRWSRFQPAKGDYVAGLRVREASCPCVKFQTSFWCFLAFCFYEEYTCTFWKLSKHCSNPYVIISHFFRSFGRGPIGPITPQELWT